MDPCKCNFEILWSVSRRLPHRDLSVGGEPQFTDEHLMQTIYRHQWCIHGYQWGYDDADDDGERGYIRKPHTLFCLFYTDFLAVFYRSIKIQQRILTLGAAETWPNLSRRYRIL